MSSAEDSMSRAVSCAAVAAFALAACSMTESVVAPEPLVEPVNESSRPGGTIVHGRIEGEGAGLAGIEVLLVPTSYQRDLLRILDSAQGLRSSTHEPEIEDTLRAIQDLVDRTRASAPRTTTGADGRFRFGGVAPGTYRALAFGAGWRLDFGAPVFADRAKSFELRIALIRAERISGQVISVDGSPAANVSVRARVFYVGSFGFSLEASLRELFDGSALRGPLETRTDATGRFEFDALSPGRWSVRASSADQSVARVHEIDAGSEGLVLELQAPGEIFGTLEDDLGSPIADASLALEPERYQITLGRFLGIYGGGDWRRRAREGLTLTGARLATDEQGRFRFGSVAPGDYRLTIRTPFARTIEERFQVGPGEVVDFGVLRAARGDSIRGRVESPDGTPIANARLTASLEGSMAEYFKTSRLDRRRSTNTRDDGTFAVHGIVPGEHSVRVFAASWEPRNVRVKSGESATNITLEPGKTIAGTVLDAETGVPIPGATIAGGGVSATADESGRFRLVGFVAEHIDNVLFAAQLASPTDDGAFVWDDDTTTAFLEARAEGFGPSIVEVPDFDRVRDVAIRLKEVSVVRGRVFSPSGEPLRAATVQLALSSDPIEEGFGAVTVGVRLGRTDEQGVFEFTGAGLFDREYVAYADHPQFGDVRSERSSLRRGELPELELRLPGLEDLRGIVRTGDRTVAGAKIVLRRPHGRERTVRSDSEGRFAFEDVPIGAHRIQALATGLGESRARGILIEEGRENAVELELDEGRDLHVEVVDSSGKPVEGASVRLYREESARKSRWDRVRSRIANGTPWRARTTGRDGACRFAQLPPVLFTVLVSRAGYSAWCVSGQRASETLVRIRIDKLARIAGRFVSKATGQPIRSFFVLGAHRELFDNKGAHDLARFSVGIDGVAADGRFAAAELMPGPYDFWFVPRGFVGRRMRVDLEPGEERVFDLELDPAAVVRGVIVDADTGRPVPEVEVELRVEGDEEGEPEPEPDPDGDLLLRRWRSDKFGRFDLSARSLPVELVVRSEEHVPYRRTIESGDRETTEDLRVELRAGLSLSGRLLDAGGVPLAREHCYLTPRNGTAPDDSRRVDTEGDGSFRFAGLLPGEYRFSTRLSFPENPHTARSTFEFSLSESRDDVEIRLPKR